MKSEDRANSRSSPTLVAKRLDPAGLFESLVRGAIVVSGAALLALATFGAIGVVGRLGSNDSLGATLDLFRATLACLIGGILVGLGLASAEAGQVGVIRLATAGFVALIFVPLLADAVPAASIGGPILGLSAFVSVGLRVIDRASEGSVSAKVAFPPFEERHLRGQSVQATGNVGTSQAQGTESDPLQRTPPDV